MCQYCEPGRLEEERSKMSDQFDAPMAIATKSDMEPGDELRNEIKVLSNGMKYEYEQIRILERKKEDALKVASTCTSLIDAKNKAIRGYEEASNTLAKAIEYRDSEQCEQSPEINMKSDSRY